MPFTLATFTKLKNSRWHKVEIAYTEFNKNRSVQKYGN